jgi:hypothetical protein
MSSEQLNSSALRFAVGKPCFKRFVGLKFEFVVRSARGDCVLNVVVCVVSSSFATVAELILRCKTTKGVVEERVKRDAEVVYVSRFCTSLSSHTSSSADEHGTDGGAVRVVPHEELEGTRPLLQQALLAAERNRTPDDARVALCAIVEAM